MSTFGIYRLDWLMVRTSRSFDTLRKSPSGNIHNKDKWMHHWQGTVVCECGQRACDGMDTRDFWEEKCVRKVLQEVSLEC